MAKNDGNPLGGRGKALEDKWIREQEAAAAEKRRKEKEAKEGGGSTDGDPDDEKYSRNQYTEDD